MKLFILLLLGSFLSLCAMHQEHQLGALVKCHEAVEVVCQPAVVIPFVAPTVTTLASALACAHEEVGTCLKAALVIGQGFLWGCALSDACSEIQKDMAQPAHKKME